MNTYLGCMRNYLMNMIDMSTPEYEEILYLKQILDELMIELHEKDAKIAQLEDEITVKEYF